MKELNLYDILAVLAPGAVVTVGIITLYPDAGSVLANKSFTIGEFGIVLLVSYVIGNLVAGLGDFLEAGYWRLRGGNPTEAAIHTGCTFVHSREQRAIEEALRSKGLIAIDEELKNLRPQDWRALTRRMYVELEQRNATQRINIFNTQYGMNRGIAAGLTVLLAMLLVRSGLDSWKVELLLVVCIGLACYRMERFSRYYTGELLRGYISPPADNDSPPQHFSTRCAARPQFTGAGTLTRH